MSSIEDFLASIKDEIESTKKEMEDVKKKVDEFIKFLTSDRLFKEWNRYYSLLYEVQNVVTPLVQRLIAFEMSIRRVEAYGYGKEEKQEQQIPITITEEGKKGIKQKLVSLVRRKKEEKKPVRSTELKSIIQYGQDIIKRLDIIWSEYRSRYYLILFQDTEEEKERELQSTLEFVAYATNICADIITFVNAAYNMRIAELEAKYESMMKSLATAEASRELPIARMK
jgi:hypothetical protein